ncbi:Ricin-type beta-trefoil lectin domain-like [Mucilaginibacter sp. OK268]|uniref:RICIN domain-containing protein n=1 Tax=Mucilaginibacter sp. OK268 TaxID=1881048 RepID=UPI00088D0345|nr:RICIN domain-containing protein [Mucilaginibacter sp. OK268]SDP91853.1 Ricin-type beta-trefoil lectin domain-like [Mucilaginibacter sp. OK268]
MKMMLNKLTTIVLLCGATFVCSCKKDLVNTSVNGTNKAGSNPQTKVVSGDYTSENAYSLNVVYFVPSDRTAITNYQTRLSKLLRWGQEFYRSNMIRNGYNSTFGMFVKTADTSSVRIIVINGQSPASSYTYSNKGTVEQEINSYFTANPTLKASDHYLVIMPVPDINAADVPFYGTGRFCYALDYAKFDIQYMGQATTDGNLLTKWFGGMMHELGHGLNLPHSHETNTEHSTLGTNLMGSGNYTLGSAPTFINRAGSAILNNCQVFSKTVKTFYNTSSASLTSLNGSVSGGNFIVSGTFTTTDAITAVNVYQDPGPTYGEPNNNYDAVAWSVNPTGNSFTVTMPISELQNTTGNYELFVSLIMSNGNRTTVGYLYNFTNNLPVISFNFDQTTALTDGVYELKAACAPGRNLDVTGSGTADDTNVAVYTDGNTSNQRWQVTSLGNGYYKLAPQHTTGKVLDVTGGSSASGANVDIYTDSGSNAQKWKIVSVGSGYYKLQPACAPTLCLDVTSGTDANNNVEIYSDNGGGAQQWRFEKIN